MTDIPDELKPPLLLRPIPKQQVAVGATFRLNLNEYIKNSVIDEEDDDDENSPSGLLYTVEIKDVGGLPLDLDYTITGEVYGQPRPPAIEASPYQIEVVVSNGATPLVTQFELAILPALQAEDEWKIDDEFEGEGQLSPDEERELFNALEKTSMEEGVFTVEKQAIWEAILQGQTIPELKALIDRPITHQEIYHLLSRIAYFVIWDANNSAPAGALQALALKEVSEHFNVYDRGSCVVATPKQLFDHNRTLLQAVKTAQAMAREVFHRGWAVEFGGFDKMVRAAWVEFEMLSDKHKKSVNYVYFQPTPADVDTLKQVQRAKF